MYNPKITTKPKINSNFFIDVRLNNGSSKAVHKEFVAKPTRLTDTLEGLFDKEHHNRYSDRGQQGSVENHLIRGNANKLPQDTRKAPEKNDEMKFEVIGARYH